MGGVVSWVAWEVVGGGGFRRSESYGQEEQVVSRVATTEVGVLAIT